MEAILTTLRRLGRSEWAAVVIGLPLFAACSSTPLRPTGSTIENNRGAVTGIQILEVAKGLLGTPYRYGGATPRGFDCSGLVHYAHKEVGLSVPRSAGEQLEHARRVEISQLRPGDLLFFQMSRTKASHVAIYAGRGRFIHAPSSGTQVSYARLDNPFWGRRLLAAGRLY